MAGEGIEDDVIKSRRDMEAINNLSAALATGNVLRGVAVGLEVF